MNNSISVNQVRNAATTIKKHANNLNSILSDVKKQMNTISNSWKSSAQEQYTKNFNSLSKNFGEFYKAVNDFGDTLNKVAENYEKFDKNVKTNASNLAN